MNWREEFNKQFGFYQDKQVVYDFDYEDLQNFISTLIEKILDDIQADRQQLLKAVEEYLEHKNDCIRSWYEAGRPIGNVGYEEKFRGKWYQSRPIDKTPKCDCGLDELLNEKGESHEN